MDVADLRSAGGQQLNPSKIYGRLMALGTNNIKVNDENYIFFSQILRLQE